MGTFIRGDVVVVPFPFTDLSNVTKRRPALVITDLEGDDIIVCQITSVNRYDRYSISLEGSDFLIGSLDVALSYVRPNRLFTADAKIVIRRAGQISEAKMESVVEQLKDIIEN